MTKGEQAFLDQYTRKLMVELCLSQMVYEDPFKGVERPLPRQNPFFDYAVAKKWLSADRTKVLSGGWMTAARFLKR
jgi:hypothetical protein